MQATVVASIHKCKPAAGLLALIAALTLLFAAPVLAEDSPTCQWDPGTRELLFTISNVSGILSCNPSDFHGKSHHFRQVVHIPTGTLVSPDMEGMVKTGMLNFFRVLVNGGYLTELREEERTAWPATEASIYPSSVRIFSPARDVGPKCG